MNREELREKVRRLVDSSSINDAAEIDPLVDAVIRVVLEAAIDKAQSIHNTYAKTAMDMSDAGASDDAASMKLNAYTAIQVRDAIRALIPKDQT